VTGRKRRLRFGWGKTVVLQPDMRRGFTVVELLMSLSVVALLLGVVAPAILDAREASRSVQCKNAMKQLSLAVHQFEQTYRYLPGGCRSELAPNARTQPNALSAHSRLLPFLDLRPTFELLDPMSSGRGWYPIPKNQLANGVSLPDVPLFHCPSDSAERCSNNFRLCTGSGHYLNGGGSMSCICGGGAGKSEIYRPRLQYISAGLSNTALVSESLIGDGDPAHFTSRRDSRRVKPEFVQPFLRTDADAIASYCAAVPDDPQPAHVSNGGRTWLLAGNAYTWYSHVLPPNSLVSDCTASGERMDIAIVTARSQHRLGVNMGYADGAVSYVSNGVDLQVWRLMGRAKHGQ